MDKTTIESLFIIQRTQPKPSDTNHLKILLTTRVAFEHQVMGIILQKTSTNKHYPKVAESENIRANHLGFAKSLFQHYCQYLGLNHNHIFTKLAFNFYVNKKISSLLETPVNTDSARETFYRELIQNTNLPTNYNFASIITEINKEIEHHTQQKYPITYASKGKKNLQTPAVTPKKIQLPIWKKTRVESPTNPSYYYTPRKKEEELEDQEFTYQNLITKNPENPNLINQPDLPPVIIINPPPVELIGQPSQPPQPNLDSMTYVPIAKLKKFIGKENNTQAWINDIVKAITANNWNDAKTMQVIPYFLKNTADSWYHSLAQKPQNFNAFKLEFLRYFSDNNSINHLASTFTTIKQEDTETVTTYLGHFHRNLHQIQAIQADYFTASIFQQVHPIHPADFLTAMTHARDFEATELEANHIQAVNLVMNKSSDLDSKLKQFNDNINQKLEGYLANNCAIYQPPQ
ncbi:hypothetical protein G9A89_016166 [Geosiphon pyriformis]|nr:hypothetical protein G9A89_016166 [Geosiphon pyriformis]